MNLRTANLLKLNSSFAVFTVQSLVEERMYPRLLEDLQYCFEFRSLRGEEINMLLEHGLVLSPSAHHSRLRPKERKKLALVR